MPISSKVTPFARYLELADKRQLVEKEAWRWPRPRLVATLSAYTTLSFVDIMCTCTRRFGTKGYLLASRKYSSTMGAYLSVGA